MEKFLLIVREDVQKIARLTKEEWNANIREMSDWVEELAQSGNYVSGEPLLTIGRYVSRDHVLSDGPFIEAKEAVSGFIMIKAENLNQAAAIAQTCPRVIRNELILEVRPVLVMDESVKPIMYVDK